MQPLKHRPIEPAFDGIASDGHRLFSFHFKHIFDDVIEEVHELLFLFQPLFIVFLVRQPRKNVKEQLDILLFGHVDGAEKREAGEAFKFSQVLQPNFTLLCVLPVLHTGHHDSDHLLQSFQFLEMFEHSLLGNEIGGIGFICLFGYLLYCRVPENVMGVNVELNDRLL